MGSQFSSGFVPSELRQHVERPLARVKVLFDAFKRLCRDDFQNNGMFITRDQFQRVFDMDVDEAHRHFGYWDRARRGRVSSVELWGAMALCCAERKRMPTTLTTSLGRLIRGWSGRHGRACLARTRAAAVAGRQSARGCF